MKVEVFSPNQFRELEQAWKRLESGTDMTVFQHYDWYRSVNDLYAKEQAKKIFRKWIYILVTDRENPVLIAPIQIVKAGIHYKNLGLARGAYFIGRSGYTDYLNFIYKDFSEKAVSEVFDYIKEYLHIRRICFEQLLETTALYRYLKKTYAYSQSECYCAALVLPDTFNEYKKMLSKSTRQNIRTAINRQKRNEIQLTHEMVYELDDDTAEKLMSIREQRLLDKKKKSLSKASFFGKLYNKSQVVISKLFNAKHDVIKLSFASWCLLVKKDDQIVSFFWGLKNDYRDEYYAMLVGVDKEFAWYSPNISHLYLFIQEQYELPEKKIKILDFTRGSEKYKEDMGASKKSAWTMKFYI